MPPKSAGLLASLLVLGASPAWAGLTATPGTLTASSNVGTLSVGAFADTGVTANAQYTAPVSDSRSVTAGGGGGSATSSATLAITNAPTPSIFTTATFDTTDLAISQAAAQGLSRYSFQILGAPGQALVTVNATGNVGYTPTASFSFATATAQLVVQEQGFGPLIVNDYISLSAAAGGGFVDADDPHHLAPNPFLSFTVADNFLLFTNTVYDVLLQADVGGQAGSLVGGAKSQSMYANVDPTFSVAGPYTIEISPGFGGVSVQDSGAAVPEPATWAILLLGFAGVGVFVRRARRAAAAC